MTSAPMDSRAPRTQIAGCGAFPMDGNKNGLLKPLLRQPDCPAPPDAGLAALRPRLSTGSPLTVFRFFKYPTSSVPDPHTRRQGREAILGLGQVRARPQSGTSLRLKSQEVFEFPHELLDILELPINGCEADVGDRIQRVEPSHDPLPNLARGHLTFKLL